MPPSTYYAKGEDANTTQLVSFGKNSALNKNLINTNPEFRLTNKTPVIDVVNDFVWTASPTTKSSLTVPYLYATELRQLQNSLVSSALYYLNAVQEGTTQIAIDYLTKLLGGNGNGTNYLALGVKTSLEEFRKNVSDFITQGADSAILTDYLKSYIGMYLTEATGFKYSFPFFEGKPHDITNSWMDSQQIKPALFGAAVEKGMDYIDKAAATLNVMQPGTYIEKPKYYHYPSEGESVTINFPLINTIRKSDKLAYQQNYELLWLLAYQNKPFRTSFSRILPPKLYTVSVPGMKFFPYAYISNMSVDFLGTRRQLQVATPKGEITTSVPEAYNVSITFTSLFADTGNLMVADGFKSPVKVKVKS